jgi:hypothetical protein
MGLHCVYVLKFAHSTSVFCPIVRKIPGTAWLSFRHTRTHTMSPFSFISEVLENALEVRPGTVGQGPKHWKYGLESWATDGHSYDSFWCLDLWKEMMRGRSSWPGPNGGTTFIKQCLLHTKLCFLIIFLAHMYFNVTREKLKEILKE